jgi:hypothetical protein
MDGQHMMDLWILDTRSTIEYIMGRMNLQDETNTLTELSHSGASQKEDSLNSTELRKPTFTTS